MPPKKRTSAASQQLRRSKRSKRDVPVEELRDNRTVIDYQAITVRNAQQSPLLRLPPELRNHIWELAFGHRTIHPRCMTDQYGWRQKITRVTKWAVKFYPCLEPASDREVYEMSLQGESADSPCHWKHLGMTSGRQLVGWHDCSVTSSKPTGFLVLHICKQIQAEAVPIAWKKTTFSFLHAADLQHFFYSVDTHVDLVQQISLIIPDYHLSDGSYAKAWERACKSSELARLSSLRGVNFVVKAFNDPLLGLDMDVLDTNDEPPKGRAMIVALIQQFRKFALEDKRTTVLVTNDLNDGDNVSAFFTVSSRRAIAERIRGLILQPQG